MLTLFSKPHPKKSKSKLFLGALLSFLSAPLVAAQKDLLSPVNPANIIQMLFALCLVLGLIVALAWLVKRFGLIQAPSSLSMRVLSSLSLSGKERVVLVEVGEQQFLIGVSPGRVSRLHTFDEAVVSDRESPTALPGALQSFLSRASTVESSK
jgi:flagellar biosynthetic protein FliO